MRKTSSKFGLMGINKETVSLLTKNVIFIPLYVHLGFLMKNTFAILSQSGNDWARHELSSQQFKIMVRKRCFGLVFGFKKSCFGALLPWWSRCVPYLQRLSFLLQWSVVCHWANDPLMHVFLHFLLPTFSFSVPSISVVLQVFCKRSALPWIFLSFYTMLNNIITHCRFFSLICWLLNTGSQYFHRNSWCTAGVTVQVKKKGCLPVCMGEKKQFI